MKRNLTDLSLLITLFGTSVYIGLLWCLHFIWYPGWEVLTLIDIKPQFLDNVDRATAFFTVLVPIMMASHGLAILLTWCECKLRYWLWAAMALMCTMMLVGYFLIRPVNETIRAGVADPTALTALLNDWMAYNDMRLIIMTAMWLCLALYLFCKQRNV